MKKEWQLMFKYSLLSLMLIATVCLDAVDHQAHRYLSFNLANRSGAVVFDCKSRHLYDPEVLVPHPRAGELPMNILMKGCWVEKNIEEDLVFSGWLNSGFAHLNSVKVLTNLGSSIDTGQPFNLAHDHIKTSSNFFYDCKAKETVMNAKLFSDSKIARVGSDDHANLRRPSRVRQFSYKALEDQVLKCDMTWVTDKDGKDLLVSRKSICLINIESEDFPARHVHMIDQRDLALRLAFIGAAYKASSFTTRLNPVKMARVEELK